MEQHMADTNAAPLGFLVHEQTRNRGKRYVAGSSPRGANLVVTVEQAKGYRFDSKEEAQHVASLAQQQYRGQWGVTTLYPRRKPTMSQDDIAAKVAARRAARKHNG